MVEALQHPGKTHDVANLKTLGTGVIVMLSLLPMIRSAAFIYGYEPRPIMAVTLILESGLSVIMLLGKVRSRGRKAERRLAATLTRAIREGGCE